MYNKNVRYSKSGYKLEWNPMTLILGIRCADGFVIGSDSKSIEGETIPIKRLDCEKINKLPNQNCLIGIAGNGDYAKRILAELGKEIKKNIKGIDVFNRKFTSIIKKIHNEDFVNEYGGFKRKFKSVEKNKDFIDSMARVIYEEINFNIGFDLIFGVLYRDNNKLNISLNEIGSSGLYLTPIDSYYPIGSGNVFAKCILKHIWSNEIKVSEAINVAIYVIEQVKAVNDDIGGQTRVAISTIKGTDFIDNEVVNRIAKKLERNDKKSLKFLKKIYYEQKEN